ncbi:TIGR04283 family arsenosugar biosynthesis glycosyltransferase [Aquisalimonas asiatica]|uniref:Transferase 2, rSAM/selenodomain-associated n=1 Tax=Aquisalimonas asiatica TaxID=406100 RepID=A0A1H8QUQ0_9GAMM|nr:TIGR04283 family arsenosugar biosynthesis glycosyltransferase [Aquisalimonas asiatica]SEO57584.1 transferase 2, rSAM/selenodomain-associated [Aquisalimonas asiatica]
MRISVIIPVLDEAAGIADTLAPLQPARAAGHEIVVVDGGSSDGTPEIAARLADRVVEGPRGRAAQMNRGAELASGDLYWFLHADTRAPDGAIEALVDACSGGRRVWGFFQVRLSAPGAAFRVIGTAMTWRSRLTGIATGDQGLFASRRLFDGVGGFPSVPLMEDVALSQALRQRQLPVCLPLQLHTSARRWQEHGIVRTVLLMWRLRLAYFLGADPARLHERYYGAQP